MISKIKQKCAVSQSSSSSIATEQSIDSRYYASDSKKNAPSQSVKIKNKKIKCDSSHSVSSSIVDNVTDIPDLLMNI